MADGFLISDTRDTTWIKPLGTGWKKVTYAAVDGLAVFEGCIILGTVAEAQAVKKFVEDNPGIKEEGVEFLRHRHRRHSVPLEEQHDSVPDRSQPAEPAARAGRDQALGRKNSNQICEAERG